MSSFCMFGALKIGSSGWNNPILMGILVLAAVYGLLLAIMAVGFSRRPKVRSFLINNLVFVLSTVMLLGGLKIFDLAAGTMARTRDIIFLPNSSAVYETPEFTYTVQINRLGFRGEDPAEEQAEDTYKILALGDSFTFGWGLELGDTWSVQAEEILKSRGIKVQIFNLGKPGGSPSGYVSIADRSLGALKPDLLIVNVLQGDDLYQVVPKPTGRNAKTTQMEPQESIFSIIRKAFKKMYPNVDILIFGGEVFGGRELDVAVTPDWKKQSEEIFQDFSPMQKDRFAKIDAEIREMYFAGLLNPKLIYDAVRVPDRFLYHENLKSRKTQRAIHVLARLLAEIGNEGEEHNCDVLVALVPYTPYVSASRSKVMQRMGYEWHEELLESTRSVEAVQSAAEMAGLDFYSAVDRFREIKDEDLYYEYDGHFNPQGARHYAEFISEVIMQHLSND